MQHPLIINPALLFHVVVSVALIHTGPARLTVTDLVSTVSQMKTGTHGRSEPGLAFRGFKAMR